MKLKKITQNILLADDGMYLTNGETFGTTIVLPESASVEEWKEITKEEKEALEKA